MSKIRILPLISNADAVSWSRREHGNDKGRATTEDKKKKFRMQAPDIKSIKVNEWMLRFIDISLKVFDEWTFWFPILPTVYAEERSSSSSAGVFCFYR